MYKCLVSVHSQVLSCVFQILTLLSFVKETDKYAYIVYRIALTI